MKFRSCDCRRIDLPLDGSRWTALLEAGEGAFAFGTLFDGRRSMTTIMVHIPYTAMHDSVHTLAVHLAGESRPHEPSWQWDGNSDKPTLSPSIACGQDGERDWHGYMTVGRLEACE